MLAVVVLLFAVCWLPLQMYNFFQSFITAINEYQYINIIWFSFHWLAMSNSCCNPFIYAIYNDKFQREFKSRLHCLRICSGNQTDSPCSELSDFDRSRVRASYRFNESRNLRNALANQSQRVQRPQRYPSQPSNYCRTNNKGRNGLKRTQAELPFKTPRSTTLRNEFDEPDDNDLITSLTTL